MPEMNELKHDMEILKKKGFNLIKLQESWAIDEPEEGKIDLSKYHELIEYSESLDMGVYLGLTCEQAPNWLWRKYPDCAMELHNGIKVSYHAQSTLRADGKPGPCYDHPGAMAEQLRFIKALVKELGVHKNIVVWNTWQEIGYWSEKFADGHVCYCPNTLKFFRSWLSEIYNKDIKNLNEHWNVRYASFEDVEPDRSSSLVCIPQQFYFRYFMANIQIANVLCSRYNAIKEEDPLKRPVFAHKGWSEIASGEDWTYSKTQDFLGVSNYPAWDSGHGWDDHTQGGRLNRYEALLTEMWEGLALKMDYIRSAAREGSPVWAAEFQGGPVSTDFHIGRIPSSYDIRRWMLSATGSGATAISFWITRAEIIAPETNGFSLLDSEGDTTERLEEASKVGAFLNKYPLLFSKGQKPQAEAAILVDEWKFHLLQTMTFVPEINVYDTRGWYKLFWTLGVPCDFVDTTQMDSEKIKNYRVLIIPLPLSMSSALAQKLVNVAERGVNVVLEGGCGRLNESGYAVRGQINSVIREALGISVNGMSMVREPNNKDRWSQQERTWGEYEDAGGLIGEGSFDGISLKANVYIERYTINTSDTSVCFTWNGKPAGVCRDIGKGKIYLIGTYLGPGATAYIDGLFYPNLKKVLEIWGVDTNDNKKLLIQKRHYNNQVALFITNPEKERISESFELPSDCKNQEIYPPFAAKISGNTVLVTVEPLDVVVIAYEK
jgi:beta-galactosidase